MTILNHICKDIWNTQAKYGLMRNKTIPNGYLLSIVMLCMFLLPEQLVWAVELEDTGCPSVAEAVLKSCKHEVREEYWINYGNCINTDNADQAQTCIQEAKAQRREEADVCRQQYSARNEICGLLNEGVYRPNIDPAEFLDLAGIIANPNPYFPLIPGMVKVFKAGDEKINFTVTEQTKQILGITCVVVRDTVSIDGVLVEDTDDWYAQDIHGNVWYFGELSRNYENGELVDLDGSWKAGVANAQPGIIMQAAPKLGDVYRQEYFLGEAEDLAEIHAVNEIGESVPAADCSAGCLVTREFLPIEPDVQEFKYYAPGIGNILVIKPETGEREELIEIHMP